ncbi:Tma46 protein [Pichia kluyveri]|uniref:Tma46 protein n=1 Tax=Pichia kluyveri TaxID=36015 RepID=A0AAV5R4L9_PICKL|nr:Tma46 protein [Pichia kluyveri]
MPPKKNTKNQQKEAEKKLKAKAKAKNAEDRTFGLRNKNKSKKVQEYISQVQTNAPSDLKKQQEMAKRRAAEKKAAEEAKKEALKLLQGSIGVQKVPFGVDPKSILCEFFKLGTCTRGKNCKFSHDLNVARKSAKRDLYTDEKDESDEKANDTMDNWDEEKLRKVILSKQGNARTTTDKVCKYFIQAVEDAKYGWFWVCPNTDTKNKIECKYRHSLPQGFVLKTKEQRRLEKMALENQPKITLEDFIETERDKLPKTNLTPINSETFAKWKKEHRLQRLNAKSSEKNKLTGREIVLKRFEDKFLREEELSADHGTEIDMSQFKSAIDEIVDENEPKVKDYGDGTGAFAEANRVD